MEEQQIQCFEAQGVERYDMVTFRAGSPNFCGQCNTRLPDMIFLGIYMGHGVHEDRPDVELDIIRLLPPATCEKCGAELSVLAFPCGAGVKTADLVAQLFGTDVEISDEGSKNSTGSESDV